MLKPMLAVAAAVILTGCNQAPATNTAANETVATKDGWSIQPAADAAAPVGRYVIVHSPQAERDTILLDTATGRTWSRVQVTDVNDQPPAWDPMPQLNSTADLEALQKVHGARAAQPNSN
jgi:hypothetical protein